MCCILPKLECLCVHVEGPTLQFGCWYVYLRRYPCAGIIGVDSPSIAGVDIVSTWRVSREMQVIGIVPPWLQHPKCVARLTGFV